MVYCDSAIVYPKVLQHVCHSDHNSGGGRMMYSNTAHITCASIQTDVGFTVVNVYATVVSSKTNNTKAVNTDGTIITFIP